MRPISEPMPNSLSTGEHREGGGGRTWEKYFICLFHVSEHVDHLNA